MSSATSESSLRTRLHNHELVSPLIAASGCGGFGHELRHLGALDGLGGLITPSMCRDGGASQDVHLDCGPSSVVFPREVATVPTSSLSASALPWAICQPTPVIVSIWGKNSGDFADAAADVRRRSALSGLIGVEVNLSVPNESNSNRLFAHDEYSATKVVGRVREHLPRHILLIAKLLLGSDTLDVARGVIKAGADVISLGYPPSAVALERDTLRPRSQVPVSFAGPALLPMMLGSVFELRAHMNAGRLPATPIIAGGGVSSVADALAAMAVGARAVQLGSVLLRDPWVAATMSQQLYDECHRRGVDVAELEGIAHH